MSQNSKNHQPLTISHQPSIINNQPSTPRKICVVGSGYVGLSNGLLLARHNETDDLVK